MRIEPAVTGDTIVFGSASPSPDWQEIAGVNLPVRVSLIVIPNASALPWEHGPDRQ
jgi:hypothetical protein